MQNQLLNKSFQKCIIKKLSSMLAFIFFFPDIMPEEEYFADNYIVKHLVSLEPKVS